MTSARPAPPLAAALHQRVLRACDTATTALLAARNGRAHWTGELSSSALSTATAIAALALIARNDAAAAPQLRATIARGCAWLISHQNADGGWGDTTRSLSNISTTTLVWAALGLPETDAAISKTALAAADRWLASTCGSLEPDALVAAIERRYGADRTFSIPILTMCALCSRLGPGAAGWRRVRALPFELAALPQSWFGTLRLPVVSYALPALIAIGLVRHERAPSRNPLPRLVRAAVRRRVLAKLESLQPVNGGFLEATPLTSFVTMSLAGCGLHAHPVARRGLAFLKASQRADGSWPIDTNLATWVTTLSLNALGPEAVPPVERDALLGWLLAQHYRRIHPYTLAAPGGWAWTDLPGGVPDADDTAGAILALARLAPSDPAAREARTAAARWLLNLQNRDGGVPTFCRGWGKLPFDRSSPDITAHALRAWHAVRAELPPPLLPRLDAASARAIRFLQKAQRPDGAWVPLWFGHEHNSNDENPLYGTARVIPALCAATPHHPALARAVAWLIAQQRADGGWCGAPLASVAASSLEETSLAVEALAHAWSHSTARTAVADALARGSNWLCAEIEHGRWQEPAPIGFYFAKLWYFEKLYPLTFATGALQGLAATSSAPKA